MAKTVTSPQELGREIKNGQEEIVIEGNLSAKVVRIMATGSVAWAIAFGAVGVAILSVLAAPAGIAAGAFGLVAESVMASIAATSATAAVSIWGLATTVSAVGIGVGARSVSALKRMKEEYKILCKNANSVTLIKK
jgi:hypothetical protein